MNMLSWNFTEIEDRLLQHIISVDVLLLTTISSECWMSVVHDLCRLLNFCKSVIQNNFWPRCCVTILSSSLPEVFKIHLLVLALLSKSSRLGFV